MLLTWHRLLATLELQSAISIKRQLGSAVLWTGAQLFSSGIILIPEVKITRGLHRLDLATSPQGITVQDYRSLVGLLEHFVFVCSLPRDVMHSLYDPISRAHSLTDTALLTPFMRNKLKDWRTLLLTGAGAPITVAIETAPLPQSCSRILREGG